MRILTVIGNRPQFVKAAAVSRLLREEHEEVLVHTGQHYDDELSRVFFDELGVPAPDRQLGAGGGSNTEQTARILGLLEGVIEAEAPGMVMVYGDTNSTLAAALAAAQARVPIAHVEAGMRSFDRAMPEELNRVLCDHASDLLLCSTQTAMDNLEREHAPGERHLVGDVMADVSLTFGPIARERSRALADHGLEPGEYVLATAHRAGQRGRPGAAGAAGGAAGGGARPRACCRCTRAPRPGSRSSACATAWTRPRACSCCRRWATWTSCAWPWTRARCSRTRAGCRRRPTCWACAA